MKLHLGKTGSPCQIIKPLFLSLTEKLFLQDGTRLLPPTPEVEQSAGTATSRTLPISFPLQESGVLNSQPRTIRSQPKCSKKKKKRSQ